MRLRPDDIDVPDESPFANDRLGRSKHAAALSALVGAFPGPAVVSVDGSFGTGKTTFLKMWAKQLEKEGHRCVYLDAWESDFVQEPLVALLGELKAACTDTTTKKAFDKVKRAGVALAKTGLPALVKAGTMGVVDGGAIAAEISGAAEKLVEQSIQNFEKSKGEIAEFRKGLANLAKELVKTESTRGAPKVIIMIDELDRCRPTYAVELLERVKHLFDVERVIFVLGVHRTQLAHAVGTLYGPDFDSSGYLRRFIDLDYRLPAPAGAEFAAGFLKTLNLPDPCKDDRWQHWLAQLMTCAGFTLREQQQTILRIVVALLGDTTERGSHYLVALLVVLREWRIDIYRQVGTRAFSPDPLVEELSKLWEPIPSDRDNPHWWQLVEGTVYALALETGKNSPKLQSIRRAAEEGDHPHQQAVWRIANSYGGGYNKAPIRRAMAAIELAAPLTFTDED